MRQNVATRLAKIAIYIIFNIFSSLDAVKALVNSQFSLDRTLAGVLGSSSTLMVTSHNIDSQILRKVDKWACINNCGACCKLGPLESRPDLPEYLTEEELTLYKSMIGNDDFCKHFDQKTKMCKIYDHRPSFCVVKPEKMKVMFDIDKDEINDFCAFCCREQIGDHYGEESDVMERFEKVIASLRNDSELETQGGEISEDGGKWISL